MERLSFITPEGDYNIKNLIKPFSSRVRDLSYIFPETKSLKPIISKFKDVMKKEDLDKKYKDIKEIIKALKGDAREISKILILQPLQFEMEKISDLPRQQIRTLQDELKDIRIQLEHGEKKRQNIMFESLGKGTPSSQIKPKSIKIYSSIHDKIRKLALSL